ncbi:MAG: phenol hydroxylase [Burkholderiaceae bacterium]|nr:MAG: phenol hydroxylase [Burkholderiaceae bacterium]
MSVTAIGEYIGEPRDVVANYHGNQLLYICWDRHLMFAAPFIFAVPPDMKFGDVLTQFVAPVIAPHPDAANIDWRKTTWERDGAQGDQPWQPDFDGTVAGNGLVHKTWLRFRTPGLDGLGGTGI